MNKKFFAVAVCLTLCAVMSVVALSGCAKKKATNGPTPSSTTEGTSSVFAGDYSVPEGTSQNSSGSSNKASSKADKGSSSSKKNTTTNSSSSKNEQSGVIPDNWELGDESSSSSKAQNTSSNKVSSKQNKPIVEGSGGDLWTEFPPGF